jgi:regulator of sigma E protease
MPPILHTVFFFVLALAILIAFHEYGHFWAARRLGVKVLRFSLGFGPVLWRRQRAPDETEFTVCALPIGGYVRMVDEREGEVAPVDLAQAFNRKPLASRAAIVFAGPLFNFVLAILIYWVAFMWGETGARPMLGPVEQGTLAQQAGFEARDEIIAVGDDPTPTWQMAISEIMERALDEAPIVATVRGIDGQTRQLTLVISRESAEQPQALHKQLGFTPFEPELLPVIDRIEPGGSAEVAGLKPGDRIVKADDSVISTWKQWVEYVRARPDQPIKALIERDGAQVIFTLSPRAMDSEEGRIGRIGAGVRLPESVASDMSVEYRLGVLPALVAALDKTAQYSTMTLKMVGRMVIGKASVDNLSGPISIAQYAGQSASMGVGQFMKFLALVSISLGVLNLVPIPVLDGGHLLFYLIEAIKGSPLSDRTQTYFQQVGMFLLLCLMALAFYLDMGRLLAG